MYSPIHRWIRTYTQWGDTSIQLALDEKRWSWQVETSKGRGVNTEFASHHELFQFIRIPPGLKNAGGTCQRAIDVILSTAHWKVALIYLDDMLTFLESPRAHTKHFVHVLMLVYSAGVTIMSNISKFPSNTMSHVYLVTQLGKLPASIIT